MATRSKNINRTPIKIIALLLAFICAGSAAFSLWNAASFAVDVGYFYGYEHFGEAIKDVRLSEAFLKEMSFFSYALRRVYVTYADGEAFDDGTVDREIRRVTSDEMRDFTENTTASYKEELRRFNRAVMEGHLAGENETFDDNGSVLSFPVYELEGEQYSAGYFLNREEFIVNQDGTVALNDDYFKGLAEEYGVNKLSEADCRRQYDMLNTYLSTVKSVKYFLVDSSGKVFTNTGNKTVADFIAQYDDTWLVSSKDGFETASVGTVFSEISSLTSEAYVSEFPQNFDGAFLKGTQYTAKFFTTMRSGYASRLYSGPDFSSAVYYPDSGKHSTVCLSYDPAEANSMDPFYTIENDYSSNVRLLTINALVIIAALALMIICNILLMVLAGRKYKSAPVRLALEDKIPGDLRLVFALGGCAVIVIAGALFAKNIVSDEGLAKTASHVAFVALAMFLEGAVIDYAMCFVRRCRGKRALRDLIIFYPVRLIKALRGNNSRLPDGVKKQFKLVAPAFVIAAGVDLMMIIYAAFIHEMIPLVLGLLIMAALCFGAMTILYRYAKSLDVIRAAVEEAHKGNYDVQYTAEKMPQTMTQLAERISSLREGFRRAVDAATRDQRTKTELITNVSHDLKTPLTSIITYSDLLSRTDLGNPDAEEYAAVINEKSLRLKQLIEDLTEASKASSGNIKLEIVDINLRELAAQAIGENEQALENAGIDLVLTENGSNPIVKADGGKTYRVLENAISNIVKYALPGSTATVTLNCTPDLGIVTFENESAEDLGNVDTEHLMERFVRGDSARGGEGSGLGLAIASDLCRLQGGSFTIDAQGKRFRAVISLPLSDDFKPAPGYALKDAEEDSDAEAAVLQA